MKAYEKIELPCQCCGEKCGIDFEQCLDRHGNPDKGPVVVCSGCGYEESADSYFADRMSTAILDELVSGVKPVGYSIKLAEAYKSCYE